MCTTGFQTSINYVSGLLTGFLSIDTVAFGGMQITGQYFLEGTTSAAIFFRDVPWDGVLGLGNPSFAMKGTVPVWYSMLHQGKVKTKVFSIWLQRYVNSAAGHKGGEIVFGGIDPAHFTGEHTYVTVENGNKNWFTMHNIIVGTKDTELCSMGCKVIGRALHASLSHSLRLPDSNYENRTRQICLVSRFSRTGIALYYQGLSLIIIRNDD